ncbi:MAG: hypothetical protein WCL18_00495 [bacterium]
MTDFRNKLYNIGKTYLPFWIFLMMFKCGAGLHYGLLSSLGSHVLPLRIVGIAI